MILEGFTDISHALRPAIYALVAKGVVIYIGKSKKPISRINNHRMVWSTKRSGKNSWIADTLGIPGVLFDEVHICPCHPDQLDELERRMIARYSPRFNTKLRDPSKLPQVMFYKGLEFSLVPTLPQGEPIRRI